jgi:hypothetical protein
MVAANVGVRVLSTAAKIAFDLYKKDGVSLLHSLLSPINFVLLLLLLLLILTLIYTFAIFIEYSYVFSVAGCMPASRESDFTRAHHRLEHIFHGIVSL